MEKSIHEIAEKITTSKVNGRYDSGLIFLGFNNHPFLWTDLNILWRELWQNAHLIVTTARIASLLISNTTIIILFAIYWETARKHVRRLYRYFRKMGWLMLIIKKSKSTKVNGHYLFFVLLLLFKSVIFRIMIIIWLGGKLWKDAPLNVTKTRIASLLISTTMDLNAHYWKIAP